MSGKYEISISNGYKIEKITRTLDTSNTYQILMSRKNRKYSEAIYNDEQTILIKHVYVCPYCNQRVPAYINELTDNAAMQRISKAKVKGFFGHQLSLFEAAPEKLPLMTPIYDRDEIVCKKCNQTSHKFTQTKSVVICESKKSVRVTYNKLSLKELIDLTWINTSISYTAFPISESVVFNFRKGKVFLEISDSENNKLIVRDITKGIYLRFNSCVLNCISNNYSVRRQVRKAFERKWNNKLPFAEFELTADKYIALTKFIGLPRTFYENLPYEYGSYIYDETFKGIMPKLHTGKRAIKTLNESQIPLQKSIRRAICRTRPWLLFFLPELKELWNIVENIDIFCSMLLLEGIFEKLMFIREYPCIIEFYSKYAKHFSVQKFVREFTVCFSDFSSGGQAFCCMSEKRKEQRMKLWKNRGYINDGLHKNDNYCYTSFNSSDSKIQPQEINGYVFSRLQNHNDYIIAGEQLNNCLGEVIQEFPVYIMKKGKETVAAIEVGQNRIFQAGLIDNGYIEPKTNKSVYYAIKTWCRKNHLDFNEKDIAPYGWDI